MKYLLPIIAVFLFQGCASDVYKNLAAEEPRGHIDFRLSSESQDVSLTMNDSLLVDEKYTKLIELQNIRAGNHFFQISGPAGNRNAPLAWSDSVMVEPNKTKTILIDTPAVSSGYWVYVALLSLPGIIIFSVN